MLSSAPITVERGAVLVYRMFDVAEAIDLAAVEASAGTSRLRITRPGGQALVIRNAPVSIGLGDQDVIVGGRTFRCGVQARLWDYGVVSLQFQLPVARLSWDDLIELAAAVEITTQFEEAARQRLAEVLDAAGAAVRERHDWAGVEDYVVYFLEDLSGIDSAAELLEKADVAAVMLGEATQPLAQRTKRVIADHSYQYWANDLAVIDWNSALVVEPSGSRDLPDVMEFALTHLIELRYYDDLLDDRIARLYASVSDGQGKLLRTNYGERSRQASALYMEITEFIERVHNSLKVIGDFYLATIFRASVSRLRLGEWEESVTRKLNILAQVSELLSAQATAHRGHVLEWIVILLIAFEIVWTLVGPH